MPLVHPVPFFFSGEAGLPVRSRSLHRLSSNEQTARSGQLTKRQLTARQLTMANGPPANGPHAATTTTPSTTTGQPAPTAVICLYTQRGASRCIVCASGESVARARLIHASKRPLWTGPLPALQALPTLLKMFDSFTPKHERVNKQLRGGFLRNLTPPLASYYGPAIFAW